MSEVVRGMKRRASFLCLSLQGNISRQEAVSMIPPLLLKIESHHKVRALPSVKVRHWVCQRLMHRLFLFFSLVSPILNTLLEA